VDQTVLPVETANFDGRLVSIVYAACLGPGVLDLYYVLEYDMGSGDYRLFTGHLGPRWMRLLPTRHVLAQPAVYMLTLDGSGEYTHLYGYRGGALRVESFLLRHGPQSLPERRVPLQFVPPANLTYRYTTKEALVVRHIT
jgi:hypothetical protein